MIVYNVTVMPNTAIAEDWLRWMREEHMPELMATGLFTGYRLSRLLEQEDLDGPTYSAQYFCPDQASYDAYIRDWAPAMREKGLARFGGQFTAFRSVMEIVTEGAPDKGLSA